MFVILLLQVVYSLEPENFLCGLRLFYADQSFFLLDAQNENTMPYILTSKSPHFALDIQQNYQPSPSLNNESYFLVGFSDAYIFAGNVSELAWIQIQEFKVKKNKTTADVINYQDYFGYYVDKQEEGGHVVISKENLIREFSMGKTDAIDRFEKMGFIYIVSWGGQGNVTSILKRFIHFLQESEGVEYCSQKIVSNSLEQIQCNLDQNFEHLTFHTPDMYHPPIHYHIGNELVNGTIENQLFINNYPGLQVFGAQNLNEKVLELRIPIKGMETHQQAVESPLSGLIMTVQKENKGFIHLLIFESDEGIVINYKEDENLAYVTIGMTDAKVYVFSFVTSSFMKFPTIDFIEHVFQDCITIIQQRNNVCEETNKQCNELSMEYFHKFMFELQSTSEFKFRVNGEIQTTPYVDVIEAQKDVQLDFTILFTSTIDNREMNHGGFIGSFLRVTNTNQFLNSLIVTQQNENLEASYNINEDIYSHSINGVISRAYVLVFTSNEQLSDMQCLQLFREFIDHIQRIFIIEQVEVGCQSEIKNFDVKPIQFKDIHKNIKQATELIQTQNQQQQFDEKDFEYSSDEDEQNIQYLDDESVLNQPMMGAINGMSFQPDEVPYAEVGEDENNYERMVDMQEEQLFQEQQQQQQQQIPQQKQIQEVRFSAKMQQQNNQQTDHKVEQKIDDSKKQQNIQKLKNVKLQQKTNIQPLKQKPVEKKPNLRSSKVKVNDENLRNDEAERYQQTFHYKDKEEKQEPEYYDRGDRYRRRSQGRRRDYDRDYESDDYYREDYGGRRSEHYGRGRDREDYYGRDDYYGDYYRRDDYYGDRRGPPLTGQSVIVPKNPNDQELGKFFREVISKLYIYSDPCDPMSTNYNQNYCGSDNQYGSSPIKRFEPKQRDFYRKAYNHNDRYEYRACITVYSECNFKGESLQLCGHQRYIPKSQLYLEILSIRADENYIIEFYMKTRNGRSELYTIKGTQRCLKTPLRVDMLLQ